MRSMEIKKWFFRTNIGYLSNNACTCVHVLYFVEVAHRPLWIPFTSYRYSRVWYKTPIPYFRWWFSNFIRSEHQMKNQCFSITWTMILPLALPMCVFMHTSSVYNGINPINFIYFNNWKINENRYYNQLVGHSEASFWRKWPSILFFDATHIKLVTCYNLNFTKQFPLWRIPIWFEYVFPMNTDHFLETNSINTNWVLVHKKHFNILLCY